MSFKQTHRWIDILDNVVHSYNHSYHRSIKMAPADVTEKDVNRLWKIRGAFGKSCTFTHRILHSDQSKKMIISM